MVCQGFYKSSNDKTVPTNVKLLFVVPWYLKARANIDTPWDITL